MAEFFRSVPRLEYFSHRLTKSSCDMRVDWKMPLPNPHGVTLKHLRTLFLEGPTNQNHVIFSSLDFPSSAALTLRNSHLRPGRSAFSYFYRGPEPEEYRNLVARTSDALQSHFIEAVSRGACYDIVRLEHHAIMPWVRKTARRYLPAGALHAFHTTLLGARSCVHHNECRMRPIAVVAILPGGV